MPDGCVRLAKRVRWQATAAVSVRRKQWEVGMQKLELLTVLRSMRLALKTSTKEQVEELIDELIADAEGTKKEKKPE